MPTNSAATASPAIISDAVPPPIGLPGRIGSSQSEMPEATLLAPTSSQSAASRAPSIDEELRGLGSQEAPPAAVPSPAVAESASPYEVPKPLATTNPTPPVATVTKTPTPQPTANATTTFEPVDFNGVTIGETTLDDVLTSWGEPKERQTADGMIHCRYVIEPFAAVDVSFADNKAMSIVIDLGRAFGVEEITNELGIAGIAPVEIVDDLGNVMGVVFPERAVSLRFDDEAETPQVAFVGLDAIDARPFMLRAEDRLANDPSAAMSDVETALLLDPNQARAWWLKSRLLSAAGRNREALSTVEKALHMEPKGAEYLLSRASLLAEAGLFDAAQKDCGTVLDASATPPHLQAQAWCVRGDLFANGPARDFAQALDAHTRAIRLAAPLVEDRRAAVRHAVKKTLIDGHLAVAQDIAWGHFQQKETVVVRWLSKAEKMADTWADAEEVPFDARLQVRRQALAAQVGLQGTANPTAWAEQLEALTTQALADCTDPARRRQIEWESGLGMYDALQSLHARDDVERALDCGEKAVAWMAEGREGRDELPTDPYRFGRLYFRLGSIHAIRRQDHVAAAAWFDRAAPLLERPLPEAAAADRGRQGESLVSMGVSYWSVGKRERAMELTTLGSRYMEEAVSSGTLDREALTVPYANLAAMHRDEGNQPTGKKFEEMATRIEADATLRR